MVEIAVNRKKDVYKSKDDVSELAKRVLIYKISSTNELLEKLRDLEEELIIENDVKIVILDSIAALVIEISLFISNLTG